MRFSGRFSVPALLVLSVAVAAVVVPLSPARAEDNITCAYEDVIVTTPGLSHTPSTYRVVSETKAALTCFGTLGDAVVAGTGWFIEKGTGYGTCLAGVGSIDIFGELPTADGGMVEVTGHLWLERTGVTGTAIGFVNGVLMTGPYVGHPSASSTRPNCDAPPPVSRGTVVKGVAASVPLQDRVAPPTPADFAGAQGDERVHLSWKAGEGDSALQVAGYRVYRDGEALEMEKGKKGLLPAGATSYIDTSVKAGTHTYTLAAVNDAGVESKLAGPLTIGVSRQAWAPLAFDPVMSPTNLKAKTSKALQSDVELIWKAPRLGQPDFYRIYSTANPFESIATVTDKRYVDPKVDFTCAYSYTYYVTAVDADGTEAWSEPLQVGPFTEPGYACP